MSIPLITPVAAESIGIAPFDPFIFATEGRYHGGIFESHPGRGLEIHLADHAPTDKFNSRYYGLADDNSDPLSGRYFRNSNNLPWVSEITDQWQWPSERKPLLKAYPNFQSFVESQGEENSHWFVVNQAVLAHLF